MSEEHQDLIPMEYVNHNKFTIIMLSVFVAIVLLMIISAFEY